jgi:hypothetical protein
VGLAPLAAGEVKQEIENEQGRDEITNNAQQEAKCAQLYLRLENEQVNWQGKQYNQNDPKFFHSELPFHETKGDGFALAVAKAKCEKL